MKIIPTLFALLFCYSVNAQLTVKAGRDTTVCAGSPVVLGGAPTASGGTGPYSYSWAPSAGLSCDTCSNPVAGNNNSMTYSVKVTDVNGDTALGQVAIIVNALPNVNVTANPVSICPGQQVLLQSSANSSACGVAPACTQTNLSPALGSGTVLQPGNQASYPGIFGNYSESCRQQMLYKASELQQVLGGPVTISGVAFDVGVFNSNAYLENFTIRIGCTSLDSLTSWYGDVINVTSLSSMQPTSGWNELGLTSAFQWDGVSNIVVELCFYDPGLSGSQNNKAVCTFTPNSSYIYSAGISDQCNASYTPVISNIRPNIRFSFCAAPSFSGSFRWSPATDADSVFSPTSPNTYATPGTSTVYYLRVTDNNGCITTDSVDITVRPNSVSANLKAFSASCGPQSNGAILAVLYGADSIHFQLANSNYTAILDSGVTANNDSILLTGLAAGTYHLLLADSVCSNIDYVVVVGQQGSIAVNALSTTLPCPSQNDGVIHTMLSCDEDSLHYKFFNFNYTAVLDSGGVADNGSINLTALSAGAYVLIVSDSLCSVVDSISLPVGSIPQYGGNSFNQSCYGDSTASGCLFISGNNAPFSYVWSDPALSGACPSNMAPGTYSVTVSNTNNCSTVVSGIIITQSAPVVAHLILSQPGLSLDTIIIAISGGTPPYTVDWGDGAVTVENDTALHQYFVTGVKLITITDANGCTGYDTIVSSFLVGIGLETEDVIKIYPNPASGQLFIETNDHAVDYIEIVDVTGTQVLHRFLQVSRLTVIDISSLNDGVYLLNAKSSGAEYHGWFIKAR